MIYFTPSFISIKNNSASASPNVSKLKERESPSQPFSPNEECSTALWDRQARGPSFLSISLIKSRNCRVNTLNKDPFSFLCFKTPFYHMSASSQTRLYNAKILSTDVLLFYLLYAVAIVFFYSFSSKSSSCLVYLYQVPTGAYLNLLMQNKPKVNSNFKVF